ncbi:hypothetical protein RF11_06387 [Thelohanellus kitauei]|uniref:Uncharacterized protein n=1 Tax=Thelohanellus kitauei TaxID=669202 RepID=A0A0C2MUS3_THEKT|nr:hypothetical protein RF11_06387 [Thelohanellus kitauei]
MVVTMNIFVSFLLSKRERTSRYISSQSATFRNNLVSTVDIFEELNFVNSSVPRRNDNNVAYANNINICQNKLTIWNKHLTEGERINVVMYCKKMSGYLCIDFESYYLLICLKE